MRENLNAHVEGRYSTAALELLDQHRVRVVRWRSRPTGCAYHRSRDIEAPHPKTPKSFAVLAHEVGHIALGHCDTPRKSPRYREEYEAWTFAIDAMHALGVPYTEHVRSGFHGSMRYALNKAIRRGLQQIPMDIASAIGFDVLTQTPCGTFADPSGARGFLAYRYNRHGERVTYDPHNIDHAWYTTQGWR